MGDRKGREDIIGKGCLGDGKGGKDRKKVNLGERWEGGGRKDEAIGKVFWEMGGGGGGGREARTGRKMLDGDKKRKGSRVEVKGGKMMQDGKTLSPREMRRGTWKGEDCLEGAKRTGGRGGDKMPRRRRERLQRRGRDKCARE